MSTVTFLVKLATRTPTEIPAVEIAATKASEELLFFLENFVINIAPSSAAGTVRTRKGRSKKTATAAAPKERCDRLSPSNDIFLDTTPIPVIAQSTATRRPATNAY